MSLRYHSRLMYRYTPCIEKEARFGHPGVLHKFVLSAIMDQMLENGISTDGPVERYFVLHLRSSELLGKKPVVASYTWYRTLLFRIISCESPPTSQIYGKIAKHSTITLYKRLLNSFFDGIISNMEKRWMRFPCGCTLILCPTRPGEQLPQRLYTNANKQRIQFRAPCTCAYDACSTQIAAEGSIDNLEGLKSVETVLQFVSKETTPDIWPPQRPRRIQLREVLKTSYDAKLGLPILALLANGQGLARVISERQLTEQRAAQLVTGRMMGMQPSNGVNPQLPAPSIQDQSGDLTPRQSSISQHQQPSQPLPGHHTPRQPPIPQQAPPTQSRSRDLTPQQPSNDNTIPDFVLHTDCEAAYAMNSYQPRHRPQWLLEADGQLALSKARSKAQRDQEKLHATSQPDLPRSQPQESSRHPRPVPRSVPEYRHRENGKKPLGSGQRRSRSPEK